MQFLKEGGIYLWDGRLVTIINIKANSFEYKDLGHTHSSGYYVRACSSDNSLFQYTNFLTPYDNITKLEKIIYGV